MNHMNNPIFALDIGTRSVTGILLQKNDTSFSVIDYCTKEHHERSMFDGQIHDVISVAEVIQVVKQTLDSQLDPLDRVSVVMAGSTLLSWNGSLSFSLYVHSINHHTC